MLHHVFCSFWHELNYNTVKNGRQFKGPHPEPAVQQWRWPVRCCLWQSQNTSQNPLGRPQRSADCTGPPPGGSWSRLSSGSRLLLCRTSPQVLGFPSLGRPASPGCPVSLWSSAVSGGSWEAPSPLIEKIMNRFKLGSKASFITLCLRLTCTHIL